jgi:hypothetical protein
MMRIYFKVVLLLAFTCCQFHQAFAQDPKLPSTNLGLSNLQDGAPPGTGWFLQQYIQNYRTRDNRGPGGEKLNGSKVNSLLSVSQLVWISKIKAFDGNFGFTVLLPVVRLSASNASGNVPPVNPGAMGDIITGPFIQWFNKRLFNSKFSHRAELDIVIPAGAYNQTYAINPGSNLFAIAPHYTFTIFPAEKFSVSMRHMLTYNFEQIESRVKPGIFYNFNYSLEYAITPALKAEIAGYFLTQLKQDSNNGNHRYYQLVDHIADTREKVFAFGPGIGYVSPSGLSLELKNMWEERARNRPQGIRTTLVLAYKFDKQNY